MNLHKFLPKDKGLLILLLLKRKINKIKSRRLFSALKVPGLAPEVVGWGHTESAAPQPCSTSLPGLPSWLAGAALEQPAPPEAAAQEQDKERTVLLNRVDLNAPEDQPKKFTV